MDDDPVLRALGAALERDDPRLAALLSDGSEPPRPALADPTSGLPIPEPTPATTHRRRAPRWVLVLGGVLLVGLLVLAAVPLGLAGFGVVGLGMLLAWPIIACWWCATVDELRPPDS